MRKTVFVLLAAAFVLATLLSASAKINSTGATLSPATSISRPILKAHANAGQKSGPQLPPEELVRQFTKKESELRDVWKEYSYVQESKLQVIGPADTVSGEYYQVSEFIFNDAGTRIERILKAPPPTLDRAGLTMTSEDKNAFINLQPFALSAEELPNYSVSLIRKEKVDELNCYVFDVIPRVMANTRELDRLKRQKIEGKFFQGKIWVDDQDLQIVKTEGKTVPEFQQRFPKFTTYRENIDERYWFPTYTYGDDNLEFDRSRIHVKMVIKYKNYRRFSSDVKILGVEEVKEDGSKPSGEAKPGDPKKDDANKPKQRPRP